MILVTGAGGKTGREVARRLAHQGGEVRAAVYRPEQATALLDLGAREAPTGDLLDPVDVSRLVDGIQVVYHICPNIHPREVEIGEALIDAARTARVERLVFHSVLYPDVVEMPHHWLKHRVEQKLTGSGLAFTILRPCAYMQNLLAQLNRMTLHGELTVPYDIEAKFSLVDLGDVAEAAATVILEAGHEGLTYDICGPEAVSHRRVAEEFGAVLGRPVKAIGLDPAAWEAEARADGLGDYAIDALLKMFAWYNRNGFAGSSSDLETLLRRPAVSLPEFAWRASSNRG